ncbi:MAG: ferric reductase-like transmembrane domain-containing protein [Spirochaetota bacterium]
MKNTIKGGWRVAVYVILVLSPLGIVSIVSPYSSGSFIYELGKSFALVGFAILCLQSLLAARLKFIEKAFGFDIVIRYHQYIALLGLVLIILHPVLVAWGGYGWDILIQLDTPWYIWAGKGALLIFLVNVVLSMYQKKGGLKFEKWRVLHDIFAPLILGAGFIHSLTIGSDFQSVFMKYTWIGFLVLGMASFMYHRFFKPFFLKKRQYTVDEVKKEAAHVWTLKMTPPRDEQVYDYAPGQFQFLTLYRGRDLPVEEHHFTISSAPTQSGWVSSTIKELGDFTSTIGKTKPGDKVRVQAPFGRFSLKFYPHEKAPVFIAGGIGITPLISNLRYLRDTGDTRSVLLLYGNKKQQDIVFHKELEEMEKSGKPRLKVIHVLQEPPENWEGETGFIDRDKIERYCSEDIGAHSFWTCGPPGLIEKTLQNLKELGVADKKIHLEIFSFL